METGSPYREGKAIHAAIAADARRRNAALLVLGGIVLGALIVQGTRALLEARAARVDIARPQRSLGSFPKVTLAGPDGEETIPSPDGPTIVHVWLQGCQDCMPAFEAVRDAPPCNGRVVNVAYGEASPVWANTYRVGKSLVFDRGGVGVVRPLGISSFTTFVVSRTGAILVRDRPDSPTYREALAPYCR